MVTEKTKNKKQTIKQNSRVDMTIGAHRRQRNSGRRFVVDVIVVNVVDECCIAHAASHEPP